MLTNIIVDVILCAIILIGAIIGVKRGFVKIAARPVKFFASLAIAFALAATVADSFILPLLETPITNYLTEFLRENYGNLTAETAGTDLPTLIRFSAFLLGLDINEVVAEGGNEAVVDIVIDKLVAPVIGIIANVIAFIIVFIVLNILFSILFAIINAIFSRGGLGVLNRSLGCIVSAALSFSIAWGLAVIAAFVVHSDSFGSAEIFRDFTGGPIYNFFNTYNPIQLLLNF